MTIQPPLPGLPVAKRRPRRKLMDRLMDAGVDPAGYEVQEWECSRCGHNSGWIRRSRKRPPACPGCNS